MVSLEMRSEVFLRLEFVSDRQAATRNEDKPGCEVELETTKGKTGWKDNMTWQSVLTGFAIAMICAIGACGAFAQFKSYDPGKPILRRLGCQAIATAKSIAPLPRIFRPEGEGAGVLKSPGG